MICPKCKEEGNKSTIYDDGYGVVTLAGFQSYYDEDGKYHRHDPNVTTKTYRCSNGHNIMVKSSAGCPNCDYKGFYEETVR